MPDVTVDENLQDLLDSRLRGNDDRRQLNMAEFIRLGNPFFSFVEAAGGLSLA